MSKDPTKQEPHQDTLSPKLSKQSKSSAETTEGDLWDLDDDDSGNTPQKPKSQSAEGLPTTRRKSESNISSKTPSERNIDIPEVTPVQPKANQPAAAITEDAGKAEDCDLPADNAAEEEKPPVVVPSLSSFTKTERVAVFSLFGVLAVAAVLAIFYFNRVPTRSLIAEKTEFPAIGKLVEIRSAKTYWRKPITTGDNADTVRRGTALIPVVHLKLSSKPCAIRVFFRDTDGIVIGDAITHAVSGEQDLVISATAGFDDIGMHAAYRTGEQEPWSIEVYEGPNRSADRKNFRIIVSLPISTDIR